MRRLLRMFGSLVLITGFAVAGLPAWTVDADADIVKVRKDCTGIGNCFETLQTALDWTWNTRNPTAGDGHVTFRGAGRESTIILGHQGNPTGSEAFIISLISAALLGNNKFLPAA